MRYLWLGAGGLSLKRARDAPQGGESEVLVRVRLAGICGTDLELVKGYYGFRGVPGHEFVGEILECRQDPDRVGQRVVGEINLGCGECEACRKGLKTHCPQRDVLGITRDGAFSNYLGLPAENLIPVPHEMSDRRAVFCEPVAAALHILDDVKIDQASRVVLIGAGRLGQLIAQVLHLTGCSLSVVARHSSQVELLASQGIRVGDEDEAGAFDVVVDATGHPSGLELACRLVRPRGTIVVKSTFHGPAEVNLSQLVVDEIRIVGSRCGSMRHAILVLEGSRIDTESLVDSVFPLEQGIEAFQRASQPGVFKVLLDCRI
jgi:2-desacetyl-2-hydroxyethyl bacteriochlorophyllide A dehydrogenase